MNPGSFEIKSTDLAARIGSFETKTSKFETPALLPVIHPIRQLIPCHEIRSMGYEAVMTNAYTTYKRIQNRAREGIHRIIDFDGTIMTDSGGYQVLEFGSVEVDPPGMARFEELIGSDIAIVLDHPTGMNVTRNHAVRTVNETLEAARKTMHSLTRNDIVWTLPIQGGRYLDLVKKSARKSSRLGFGCYALGSPVEVMEEYDFPLLVKMICSSKKWLPEDRPFHLFGAGHPLVLPLAVALGCDMFDSASYMLYANNDRYISSSLTQRLDRLEFLPCVCPVCSNVTARELKSMGKNDRVILLARHNLFALKQVMEETKQAIWEGRLWEYVRSKCSTHPHAFEAFKLATSNEKELLELGTPDLKDRGVFISDRSDMTRPEVSRHFERIRNLDLRKKEHLVVVPEPRTKPFLSSEIFSQILKLIDRNNTLVCYTSKTFGVLPAEISDIFPVSQVTTVEEETSPNDYILRAKKWKRIDMLLKPRDFSSNKVATITRERFGKSKTQLVISSTFKSFKRRLAQV